MSSDSARVTMDEEGKVAIYKSHDRRLRADDKLDYTVPIGAEDWTYRTYDAVSHSSSSVAFQSVKPPSDGVMTEGRFWVEYIAKITLKQTKAAGSANFGTALSNALLCPRSFPLQSCCSRVSLRVNGRDCFVDTHETLAARMHYMDQAKLDLSYSCCPHRKLLFQTLADASTATTDCTYQGTDNTLNGNINVEGFTIGASTVAADGKTQTSVITLAYREPLLVDPLDYSGSALQARSMYNLTTMDITMQLVNGCCRMLVMDPTLYDAGWRYESATFEKAPVLHIAYATPGFPLSDNFYTLFKEWNVLRNLSGYHVAGTSVERATSAVFTLSYHPRYIWLWVQPKIKPGALSIFQPDSFAEIEKVEFEYGPKSKILVEADQGNLYQLCVKNGLRDVPLQCWKKVSAKTGCGSVLRLEVGVDISTTKLGIPSAAGLLAHGTTLKAYVTYNPRHAARFDTADADKHELRPEYEVCMMLESEGVLQVSKNHSQATMVVIQKYSDLIEAPLAYDEELQSEPPGLQGGRISFRPFLKKVGNWFRDKAPDIARTAATFIPGKKGEAISKVISTAGDVARTFMPADPAASGLSRKHRKHNTGVAIPGGAMPGAGIPGAAIRAGRIIPPSQFYHKF